MRKIPLCFIAKVRELNIEFGGIFLANPIPAISSNNARFIVSLIPRPDYIVKFTRGVEDFEIKTLFPEKYKELVAKETEIENKTVPKSTYNGKWVMANFPSLKPGPIIGKITLHLFTKFGDKLEVTPETEVKAAVEEYIKTAQG